MTNKAPKTLRFRQAGELNGWMNSEKKPWIKNLLKEPGKQKQKQKIKNKRHKANKTLDKQTIIGRDPTATKRPLFNVVSGFLFARYSAWLAVSKRWSKKQKA